MKMVARLEDGTLTVDGFPRVIPIRCDVRNELNGRRDPTEVVYTLPGGRPYYPRQFPKGRWKITDVRARSDSYRKPFFIATDASQLVDEWSVSESGGRPKYDKPTGRKVVDREYGLHYSTSPTTTGCIKILQLQDLLELVDLIKASLLLGEVITLEVV